MRLEEDGTGKAYEWKQRDWKSGKALYGSLPAAENAMCNNAN